MSYINSFCCVLIVQLLTLPLSIFSMKSHREIVPVPKPRMVVFPHNDIIAVANKTTCAVTNITTKESSILLDNTTIYHITRHPEAPLILVSTEQELALYDVRKKTKKWSAAPLHKNASTAFNTNTQQPFAYHKGLLTFYNITTNADPITHNIPFDEKDVGDSFCHISFNKSRNEISYMNSAASISCINADDVTNIKTNYAKHKDWIFLGPHMHSPDGNVLAVQCSIMGCYLYPPTLPNTLKIFRNPKHVDVCIRGIALHPNRPILAILDDYMFISYVNVLTGQKIAQTYPHARHYSIIKSLEPIENYQIDFSPDGKKLVIRDACLTFGVPHNSIFDIYCLLREVIRDKKVIKYIFYKLARFWHRDYRLEKLSLTRLSRT